MNLKLKRSLCGTFSSAHAQGVYSIAFVFISNKFHTEEKKDKQAYSTLFLKSEDLEILYHMKYVDLKNESIVLMLGLNIYNFYIGQRHYN